MLTKTQEEKNLDAIVEGLEDGYLKDILGGLVPQIKTAIRCDFGYVEFNPHTLISEREKLEREIKEAQQRLRQVDELARQAERKTERAKADLEECRSLARSVLSAS